MTEGEAAGGLKGPLNVKQRTGKVRKEASFRLRALEPKGGRYGEMNACSLLLALSDHLQGGGTGQALTKLTQLSQTQHLARQG